MEYKVNMQQMGRMSSPSTNHDDDIAAAPNLVDFLVHLENYNPSIPDPVISYYLNQSGFEAQDPRIIRLVGLAAQKFLSDIANDALQHCKMRTSSQTNQPPKNAKGTKDKKLVMTIEDLEPALKELGIVVRKPPYFV